MTGTQPPQSFDHIPDLMDISTEQQHHHPYPTPPVHQPSQPHQQQPSHLNTGNLFHNQHSNTTGSFSRRPNPAQFATHKHQNALHPSQSTVSTATTATQNGINPHHHPSFAKSWSLQFVHGKIVPPITASTLHKEDITEIYPTRPWSSDYAPFWWANLSHFIMFVAYSLNLNLLTTVYGSGVSILIGMLYVFFIISSFAMPPINTFVFKNNTIGTIFCGTLGYTTLMFTSIFGNYYFLGFGCIIAGSCGGLVWVGFSSVLSIMSRHFVENDFIRDTKQRLHTRLKTTPETQQKNDEKIEKLVQQLLLPNGRVNLGKLTDEQTKRLINSTAQCISWNTSISWVFLSFSSVVGSLISFFVLSNADPANPTAAAQRLFIVFTLFGVVSCSLYFRTWLKTPVTMFASNDQPLQVDNSEDHENDNIDIVDAINDQGDVIHTSKSAMFSHTFSRQTLNSQVPTSPASPRSPNNKAPIVPYQPNALESTLRSLYMMKNMVQQRVVLLSLFTWYHTLFPISLAVSFLTANAIKPTLGAANVPLFMMTVYLTDSISAYCVSKIMKGFVASRWAGLIGSFVQIFFIIMVLVFPHSGWVNPDTPDDHTKAWIIALFLGSLCGIGDAIAQSGIGAALGILVEGSVTLKSSGFSLSQICKCLGSTTIFFTGRFISFQSQTIMVLIIVCISICCQVLNFYFHQPMDVDLLNNLLNEYIKEQEDRGRQKQQQQQEASPSQEQSALAGSEGNSSGPHNEPATGGTDLDDLGSSA